jgi:hypothetical protein
VPGEIERQVLFPQQITDAVTNSLNWYEFFPGGKFVLSPNWPSQDLLAVAKRLACIDWKGKELEQHIDDLTLALLAHGNHKLPDKFEWQLVAKELSLLYIHCFKYANTRRLRMKAQRANYYLRFLIDCNLNTLNESLDEKSTLVNFPWDMLFSDGYEVYIGSGVNENVFIKSTYSECKSLYVEKPTQLTKLQHDKIAIGSLYHAGWYEVCLEGQLVQYYHHRPVVLVFLRNAECCFLDVDGGVYTKDTRKKIIQINVGCAWRARCLDGKIFISDLTSPETLLQIDITDWSINKINVSPVLLVNDVCLQKDGYYLIDKMQGRIFKFDHCFKFLESRLSFGFGFGSLSDPISIKVHKNRIYLLSWLVGKLTIMDQF